MSLNDKVKKITENYLSSVKLTDALFATVSKINPLEVNVDQRYPLEGDFLVVPEHLTEYKLSIEGQEYTIRKGLEIGDKLIILRQQGGLNFIVLGRLVE